MGTEFTLPTGASPHFLPRLGDAEAAIPGLRLSGERRCRQRKALVGGRGKAQCIFSVLAGPAGAQAIGAGVGTVVGIAQAGAVLGRVQVNLFLQIGQLQ